MIIDRITKKFMDNPAYLRNGAGFLAQSWGCSKEEIYLAKEKARSLMEDKKPVVRFGKEEVDTDLFKLKYTGSEQTDDGAIKKFESPNPLTPKEIEELAGVDNINTYVARVWDKLLPSGRWVYSIDIRNRVKDFYTKEQLAEKLKELMPNISPVNIVDNYRQAGSVSKKALVICLADDHVGAINVTNLFDNKDFSYEERLEMVLQEIVALDETFEEIHIVSLGDQMNGWSGQTTRGGHEVKSKSNQEQFDEYVAARVKFYDKLFASGISDNYFVHDVENSNHSGLGMSYMANKAISMWMDAKYPQVIQESTTQMIGGFQYGQHVVIFGHGKDEKFAKRPMPAVLNPNTDLYLYDYIQNKGYSPYKDKITFYKGDLHQLGFQMGKFGRYVNVQSIAGNSDYGDINFGNTKGGALLEILHKDSYKITSQPIWF
jgi:hypothetical protein